MALRDSMSESAAEYLRPGEPIQAVIGAQTASHWSVPDRRQLRPVRQLCPAPRGRPGAPARRDGGEASPARALALWPPVCAPGQWRRIDKDRNAGLVSHGAGGKCSRICV